MIKVHDCNNSKHGAMKLDIITVWVILLNVIGQNVNQWYLLKMNI